MADGCTLLILAGYFLSTRMADPPAWRRWRGIFWITIVFGILCTPIAHNTQLLYRPVNKFGLMIGRKNLLPRQWDPTYRLRGVLSLPWCNDLKAL